MHLLVDCLPGVKRIRYDGRVEQKKSLSDDFISLRGAICREKALWLEMGAATSEMDFKVAYVLIWLAFFIGK